ncbi:hypothetical protein LOD99_15764 [Oopsacas minuta]|uniref:TRAF-type domain-containing protein n=1 Tax=Oopsacas minuta TaxID=111878 RepID=A0AAV7KAI6_9METZ|nr:hypothetical protein LOD99_15764 [Oopsacas minuta]
MEPEVNTEELSEEKAIDKKEEFLFERIQESELFGGYKRDYLAQNLDPTFNCPSCNGIPREAVQTGTETKCATCATPEDNPTPNDTIRDTVLKLEVMCPLLRSCEWSGTLSEIGTHLDECLFLHLYCPMKCETVIARGELEAHTYSQCLQRKVQCEYCKQFGLAKGLESHYQNCKDFPVTCPHGCGECIPRRQSEIHNNTNCPMGEVTCPYSKYGCVVSRMTRRDLIGHKQESIAEHLDMSTEFHARKLVQAEEEIRRLRDELSHTKMQIKYKKDLDGVEWKIEGISSKMEKKGTFEGPIFFVGPLKLQGLVRFERRIKSNAISFHIKRLSKGKDSQILADARFTYCCVTLVNLKNEAHSKLQEKHVSYKIEVDQLSDCIAQFGYDDVKTPDFQRENSIFVWFHFDLDPEVRQDASAPVVNLQSHRRFYHAVVVPRGGGAQPHMRREIKSLAF